jgi:hypothetical protein
MKEQKFPLKSNMWGGSSWELNPWTTDRTFVQLGRHLGTIA